MDHQIENVLTGWIMSKWIYREYLASTMNVFIGPLTTIVL